MSMLDPYVQKPDITPLEMAKNLLNVFYSPNAIIYKDTAKECALIHLELRKKDGLYMTLTQHWITYWNEVENYLKSL